MVDLLDRLLAQFDLQLPTNMTAQAVQFLDELLRWNERINLTSITVRSEAVEKHLLDSLLLLKYLPKDGCLLDMGSGGGLPGIPLAIASPGLQIVSIDSVGKKINFQKHIKRQLSLGNFQPIHARVEEFVAQNQFDFVVARAMSDFATLGNLSAPKLKVGGQLLVMKGPEGTAELEHYLRSGNEKSFAVKAVHNYQLPESCSERQLIILTKTSH